MKHVSARFNTYLAKHVRVKKFQTSKEGCLAPMMTLLGSKVVPREETANVEWFSSLKKRKNVEIEYERLLTIKFSNI